MNLPPLKKSGQVRKPWNSRSLGNRFQHRIFYAFIRIGGQTLAYILLYIVVFYYVLLRPSVAKKTDFYLLKRFPRRRGWERFRDRYRLSLSLGKVLVDRAFIGITGPSRIKIRFEEKEKLLSLLSPEKGFILMNAHAGGWQVVLSAMPLFSKPVNMLLERDQQDADLHYFEHAGLSSPFRIIDPQSFLGGSLQMLDVLKRGEILCVMGDRVFGNEKSVVEIDFLGRKAFFPFIAFKIASAAEVPVVVFFSYKSGLKRYDIRVADIIHVSPDIGRSRDAFRPYVGRFVVALESFIKDHPYDFFNFYDMWSLN
ncbi:MAG: lysophospholipid acyltransferase family protein [Thermodesulfobacteriota bacterium]